MEEPDDGRMAASLSNNAELGSAGGLGASTGAGGGGGGAAAGIGAGGGVGADGAATTGAGAGAGAGVAGFALAGLGVQASSSKPFVALEVLLASSGLAEGTGLGPFDRLSEAAAKLAASTPLKLFDELGLGRPLLVLFLSDPSGPEKRLGGGVMPFLRALCSCSCILRAKASSLFI